MNEPTKSRFRAPHFGWLALATATVVVAGFPLALWIRHYRQQSIIDQIVESGGNVESEAGGPTWLRQRIGDENMGFFDRVVRVSLQDTATDDATMARLTEFSEVTTLDLRRTRISDAGLEFVTKMKKLENLWLAGTRIGDAGIAKLKDSENLTSLNLDATRVSDRGLAHISEFSNLQRLNLNRTNVTDTGLLHLHRLKNLATVGLQHTRVSKAGCDLLADALPGCEIRR